MQWNPDPTLCLLIVSNEENVLVITPDLYAKKVNEATRALLLQTKEYYDSDLAAVGKDIKEVNVKWTFAKDLRKDQILITMEFKHIISRLTWHPKGDYFATMAHKIQATTQVIIHSLRKASSQKPFS